MSSARLVGVNENISTYGGTGLGRDYTSLATWEAATDVDLVTGAVSEVLECYDDEVFDDGITLAGATTNASYFRIIRPAGVRGEASWQGHDGTPNVGVRFSSPDFSIFTQAEHYSWIQDICGTLVSTNAGGYAPFVQKAANYAGFVGCIAYDCSNTAGVAYGFYHYLGSNPGLIDCLAINCQDGGIWSTATSSVWYIENCTVVDSLVGIGDADLGDSLMLTNCLCSGNTTDFAGANIHASSDYNASSDTTAPGGNSRVSQTFTFVDAASDDYHLAATDTGALGLGTDLSAAYYPFDDDIDGQTIVTWSIGADSDAVAGGTLSPGHSYQYRRRAGASHISYTA